MKKLFQSTKWFLLLSGVIIVLLGITMLFTPLSNLLALIILVGITMLVSGISEMISYCTSEKWERSGWMLASGIITTILGIWVVFGSGSNALLAMLPMVFAVWIMTASIMRIVGSINLKAEGFTQWGWMLALGILGTLLGLLLLFSPILSSIIISYTIAFTLIVFGINNIIMFFRLKRLGDHIRKNLYL